MKEPVSKFNMEAAFKALDEIDVPKVSGGIIPNRVNLKESMRVAPQTDILFEEYYDLNNGQDVDAAKEEREAEVAKAKLARIEKIVDLDAETEEDILPSYEGKMIMQCPQCMTLFYKNPEDIEYSEENPDVVNINEVCQHCGNTSGYTLVGKVAKVGEDEADKYDTDEVDDILDANAEANDEEQPAEEPAEQPAEENTEELPELPELPAEEEEEKEETNESLKEAVDEKETDKLCSITANGEQIYSGTKEECEKYFNNLKNTVTYKARPEGYYKLLDTAKAAIKESVEQGASSNDVDDTDYRPGFCVEYGGIEAFYYTDEKKARADYAQALADFDELDSDCSGITLWKLGATEDDDVVLDTKTNESLNNSKLLKDAEENSDLATENKSVYLSLNESATTWNERKREVVTFPDYINKIWEKVEQYCTANNIQLKDAETQKKVIDIVCTDDEIDKLRNVKGSDGLFYSAYPDNITEDTNESLKGSAARKKARKKILNILSNLDGKADEEKTDLTADKEVSNTDDSDDDDKWVTYKNPDYPKNDEEARKAILKKLSSLDESINNSEAQKEAEKNSELATENKSENLTLNEGVVVEVDLADAYEPWQGAVDTWEKIKEADKIEAFEDYLNELYPDGGLTLTQINDMLWFDGDQVLADLGLAEPVEESLNEAEGDVTTGEIDQLLNSKEFKTPISERETEHYLNELDKMTEACEDGKCEDNTEHVDIKWNGRFAAPAKPFGDPPPTEKKPLEECDKKPLQEAEEEFDYKITYTIKGNPEELTAELKAANEEEAEEAFFDWALDPESYDEDEEAKTYDDFNIIKVEQILGEAAEEDAAEDAPEVQEEAEVVEVEETPAEEETAKEEANIEPEEKPEEVDVQFNTEEVKDIAETVATEVAHMTTEIETGKTEADGEALDRANDYADEAVEKAVEEKTEEEVPAEETVEEEQPEEEAEETKKEEAEEAEDNDEEIVALLDEIDDASVEECLNKSLQEVYSNIENFKLNSKAINEEKDLVVEGTINFKSGKQKATRYIFNECVCNETPDAIIIELKGVNNDLADDGVFVLNCKGCKDAPMMAESFSYNYHIGETLVEGLIK